MGSASWPREPSREFERWALEFGVWREHRSPQGTEVQSVEIYRAHGGLEEVATGGDLEWVGRTEATIQRSQQIIWDAHAREVLAAAAEGGLEATAEALREPLEWIQRLEREGKCVDERTDAARLVDEVLRSCPANPLIRAEEIWTLWESVTGARRIAERLRDQLLEELETEGYPRTRMAKRLGWSYSRLHRRVLRLEEERLAREQRVRQGEFPGVIDMSSRKPWTRA